MYSNLTKKHTITNIKQRSVSVRAVNLWNGSDNELKSRFDLTYSIHCNDYDEVFFGNERSFLEILSR